MLSGKRILVGIGGGIAVYRVAELVRLLMKRGAEVRCVMTKSAREFVTPLTFEALTGEEVHTELFDLTSEREMGHIRLARWADAVVIAPATANLMTKLAYGIADDLLSTIMQVNDKPVLVAPAMNHSMWESAATRANVDMLKVRGIRFSGPALGELVCGELGPGRLNEPEQIVDDLLPLLVEQKLAGQQWIIDTGPTREHWDAVRLLTNRASGSLGAHLADLASAMGAGVTLVAGPGTPACSTRVSRIDIESADEMLAACLKDAANADVFVATAAVSDLAFKTTVEGKLKRGDTTAMQVELKANPDIVATVAALKNRPKQVIAFAAEATDHIAHARDKMKSKGVDAIFANDVANMGSETAGGWWVTDGEESKIEAMPKVALAQTLIERITELKA